MDRFCCCCRSPIDQPESTPLLNLESVESELGLTSKLPDDVLLNVFSHLDSFLDRLRVAKVNRRFRKCVFKAMKTPQPLKFDFEGNRFCGHQLPQEKWPAVVRVLAREARFDKIEIGFLSNYPNPLPEIYQVLLSSPVCLSQLTSFIVSTRFPSGECAVGLDTVLDKCPKLSIIKLSPMIQLLNPPNTDPADLNYPTLDLVSSLRDKSVTELNLYLLKCTEQNVIDILQSVEPNALQKLQIGFRNCHFLNVVELVRALCHTAAESIEEIAFSNECPYNLSITIPLGQLFNCLPDLPSLRRFFISGPCFEALNEMIPAVMLLLSNHARSTPLTVEYKYDDVIQDSLPCCQLLFFINPMLNYMPQAVFCLDRNMDSFQGWKWKIAMGNVSLVFGTDGNDCGNPDCHPCHCCFPVVVSALAAFADDEQSGYLENHWLDRCRIQCLIEHPLMKVRGAFDAVENAAHDLATITFEPQDGRQFQITVATGRCFERSCIRCLPIY